MQIIYMRSSGLGSNSFCLPSPGLHPRLPPFLRSASRSLNSPLACSSPSCVSYRRLGSFVSPSVIQSWGLHCYLLHFQSQTPGSCSLCSAHLGAHACAHAAIRGVAAADRYNLALSPLFEELSDFILPSLILR